MVALYHAEHISMTEVKIMLKHTLEVPKSIGYHVIPYILDHVIKFMWHEAKCIDIVVSEIQSKLPHTISSIDEPLVGMKCRIEEGTKNIEGILLHPQCEWKHIDIAIEAFREMHKLRLLEIHNVWTPKVPEYLPSELRWLIWDKFPLESLPPRFEAENLVGLQLYCSSIERTWRGEKDDGEIEVHRPFLFSKANQDSRFYMDPKS
ncbi:hypothetical protein LguiA_029658 [Lonicera macranthoides]